MTVESCALRADLRALMMSPAIGLCEYNADPVIQRRVGRMLVDAAKVNALAATKLSKVTASKAKRATFAGDTKPVFKLVPKDRS